jgi:Zn-finger protein
MKITIQVSKREGFVKNYVLLFDNGSVLSTQNCLWIGSEAKQTIKKDLLNLLEGLISKGVEVDQANLEDFKNDRL